MGLFKWVVMPLYLFSGTFFADRAAAGVAAVARLRARRCGTASTCAAA